MTRQVRLRKAAAAIAALAACLLPAACGRSGEPREAAETARPALAVELTPDEKRAWERLPADRSAIPVLLYHGLGSAGDFANSSDAAYGIRRGDFAKQMAMMAHAGYRTISLETFIDFVQDKPVELPARPLLLTFDDARVDSWTGADRVLNELGFNAVMFVDVGRVDAGDPEYLSWRKLNELEASGRWDLQLHSGQGHRQIRHGSGARDFGPFYAYRQQGEDLADWRERVRSDITWARETLSEHVPAYEPLAFAPPYGNYGQDGTNDPRIPYDLGDWLSGRFDALFTQDRNARAKPGERPPFGRIQVNRWITGGELFGMLLSGEQ